MNLLTGSGQSNFLYGAGGSDVKVVVLVGANQLNGGSGIDTASYFIGSRSGSWSAFSPTAPAAGGERPGVKHPERRSPRTSPAARAATA